LVVGAADIAGRAIRIPGARTERAFAGDAAISIAGNDGPGRRLHADEVGRARDAAFVAGAAALRARVADGAAAALVVRAALGVAIAAIARERPAARRSGSGDAHAVVADLSDAPIFLDALAGAAGHLGVRALERHAVAVAGADARPRADARR